MTHAEIPLSYIQTCRRSNTSKTTTRNVNQTLTITTHTHTHAGEAMPQQCTTTTGETAHENMPITLTIATHTHSLSVSPKEYVIKGDNTGGKTFHRITTHTMHFDAASPQDDPRTRNGKRCAKHRRLRRASLRKRAAESSQVFSAKTSPSLFLAISVSRPSRLPRGVSLAVVRCFVWAPSRADRSATAWD